MVATKSHHLSIKPEDWKKVAGIFRLFVKQEITVWVDFMNFWLNAEIPVYLMRYEDVMERPMGVLPQAISFILDVDSISGTKIEKYIELAVTGQRPENYKPRQGQISKNKSKYDIEMVNVMVVEAAKLIRDLGYEEYFA